MKQLSQARLMQKPVVAGDIQQALRILECSVQDLQAEILHEYMENPLLEMDDAPIINPEGLLGQVEEDYDSASDFTDNEWSDEWIFRRSKADEI